MTCVNKWGAGHDELNAADKLEMRCRVAGTLAEKERHRQRMTAPENRWSRPALWG